MGHKNSWEKGRSWDISWGSSWNRRGGVETRGEEKSTSREELGHQGRSWDTRRGGCKLIQVMHSDWIDNPLGSTKLLSRLYFNFDREHLPRVGGDGYPARWPRPDGGQHRHSVVSVPHHRRPLRGHHGGRAAVLRSVVTQHGTRSQKAS